MKEEPRSGCCGGSGGTSEEGGRTSINIFYAPGAAYLRMRARLRRPNSVDELTFVRFISDNRERTLFFIYIYVYMYICYI